MQKGDNYQLNFYSHRYERGKGPRKWVCRETVAEFKKGEDVIQDARVVQKHKEQDIKALGRYYAFTKLVEGLNGDLTKQERKALWTSYLSRSEEDRKIFAQQRALTKHEVTI